MTSPAGPTPILAAERIKRQPGDAVLQRRLDGAAHRLRPGPVPGDARQSARRGPASVAVHDDGDVRRDRGRRRGGLARGKLAGAGGRHARDQTCRMSRSFSARLSSTRLMYWSVSFCTSSDQRSISSSLRSCFLWWVLMSVHAVAPHRRAPRRAHPRRSARPPSPVPRGAPWSTAELEPAPIARQRTG